MMWLSSRHTSMLPNAPCAEEATRLGLTVRSTLGVLDRAAEKGWLDLPYVAQASAPQQTFGFHPPGSNRLLGDDARRKGQA